MTDKLENPRRNMNNEDIVEHLLIGPIFEIGKPGKANSNGDHNSQKPQIHVHG